MKSNINFKSAIYGLSFFVLLANAFSQENDYLHKYTPPAPNAAALAKYGDMPVSYYTGTPQISIPIYTATEGSLSVPIALSYHASGFKVDEKASWVGLGWSLNAGGMISRTVRGLEDEKASDGFFTVGSLIDNIPTNAAEYYESVLDNEKDSESDIYFFSFPGGSGKFFYDYNRNKYFQSLTQIDIQDPSETQINDLWIITNTDGTKYFFSQTETTVSTFGEAPANYTKTGWHLDKMVSADLKDTILFEYYPKEIFQHDLQPAETFHELIPSPTGCGNCPQFPANSVSYGHLEVDQLLLKKITTSTSIIEFNKSSRLDLTGGNRLTTILIKDANGQLKKRFELDNAAYFGTTHKRLKLNSVTEYGSNGDANPPHSFIYDETYELPDYESSNVDHWGYFNNNTVNSFIPDKIKSSDGAIFLFNDTGGNRETDPNRVKTNVLTQITYPTGGSSTFDYECHDVAQVGNTTYTDYFIEDLFLESYDTDNGTKTTNFTLTETTTIQITATAECENGGSEPATAYVYVAGELIVTCSDDTKTVYRTLTPGTYSIQVTSEYFNANWYSTARASVLLFKSQEVTLAGSNLVGGVRVTRITNSDNNGNQQIRKFDYTDGQGNSTGVLVRRPYYYYKAYKSRQNEGGCANTSLCEYNSASSNSKVSLGEGGHIGYSKVTELYGENGENGYKVYTFTTASDHPDVGGTEFPYAPADSNEGRRGRMLSEITFHANGDTLVKKEYEYSNPSKKVPVRNLKVGNVYAGIDGSAEFLESFENAFYYNQEEWQYMKKETITTYLHGRILTDNTEYFYDRDDNHLMPTRTVRTRSDGRTSISRIKYPQDYATAVDSDIDSMVAKNIIRVPIEQQEWIEESSVETMLSGQIFQMNEDGKPEKIWLYEGKDESSLSANGMSGDLYTSLVSDDDFKERYIINYNADKKVNSQRKKDDVETAIIWDESIKRPIAQAIDASPDQIAFTGFETPEKGGWSYSLSPSSGGFIGLYYYTSSLSKSDLPAGNYELQLWARATSTSNNTITVKGIAKTIGTSWELVSWTFSHIGGTTLSVSPGSAIQLDEVRLFPKGSQMQSFSYDPVYGVTDMVDANGQPSKYIYDSFGRLITVKDHDGNIQKKIEYNYKNN